MSRGRLKGPLWLKSTNLSLTCELQACEGDVDPSKGGRAWSSDTACAASLEGHTCCQLPRLVKLVYLPGVSWAM